MEVPMISPWSLFQPLRCVCAIWKQPTWQVILETDHLFWTRVFFFREHAKIYHWEKYTMQNSWKLNMIQCPSSFHFHVNQLFWWGVVAWLLQTIISTILSCSSSLSTIFMCKPLFSTDIHLPQCTRLFIYIYMNKCYSITTIDTFASFLWQLSTKSYLTWTFCGSSKQESSLLFSNFTRGASAEFIAARGGHRWEPTAHRLTLECSGCHGQVTENSTGFWCGKLLEMSGHPPGFKTPYPWRCLL